MLTRLQIFYKGGGGVGWLVTGLGSAGSGSEGCCANQTKAE